jgi:hypothetical protein
MLVAALLRMQCPKRAITTRVSLSLARSKYTGNGVIFSCTINERRNTPSSATCTLPEASRLISSSNSGSNMFRSNLRLKYMTLSSMLPARLISCTTRYFSITAVTPGKAPHL